MKNFMFLVACLFTAMGFAQTLPLDFEVPEDDGFTGFNGTSVSVVTDPTDATNMVAEFVGGTNQWDGAAINLATYVDLSDDANNTVTFDMWVPAGSSGSHLLKFEGGSSGATQMFFTTTASDDWETVSVDFGASLGTEYPILVIFTDCGNGSDITTSGTYYVDNINGPNGATVPVEGIPETAAPTPTQDENAQQVISIFSDAYTDISGSNFNPNWGQSTNFEFYDISGNINLKYSALNYQGTNIGSANGDVAMADVSNHDFIHVDFWTPNSTELNFYLISGTGANAPAEFAYSLPITTEEWVSVDIPLSHFSDNSVNLADIKQIKVDGNGTVYFDNWFFWVDNLGVEDITANQGMVTLYPNPVQAGMNFYLQSDNEEVAQVSVFNMEGKLVKTVMNTDEISTQGLDKGVYLLSIETVNGNIENEKLIVR